MLKLSESIIPLILQRLIIAQVGSSGAKKGEVLSSLRLRLEIAAARALVDSFIVFGISFFSSLLTLGFATPILNLKVAFVSACVIAGLSFFTGLKKRMK